MLKMRDIEKGKFYAKVLGTLHDSNVCDVPSLPHAASLANDCISTLLKQMEKVK